MSEQETVVVVGGGIAGLAAVYSLHTAAPELRIRLLERDERLGGKVVTERVDGFVVEGGPDCFLSSKPAGIALCRELGMDGTLEGTDERNRGTWVLRRGRLVPLPEGLSGLVPARLGPIFRSPLLSPGAKLRLAAERWVPARRDSGDESLAAFMTRRMGRETYQRLVEPLMAGIYAGDGDRLSLEATFPQLRRLELDHGSLLSGLGRQTAKPRGPRPGFLTPINGMAEIVEDLTRALAPGVLCCRAEVEALERDGAGYAVTLRGGTRMPAKAAILATPAYVSSSLVSDLDPALAQLLGSIPYVSSATLSLAYRAQELGRPLKGYGYIVPRAEGRPVLACTWSSSKFEHRAPEDGVLLRLFFGRAGQDEVAGLPEEELVRLARRELWETLGIVAEPAFHRLFRWPSAMPQYNLGHSQRVSGIRSRLERLPGISLCGAAYSGVGIPDCIASGKAAAAETLRHINEKHPAVNRPGV